MMMLLMCDSSFDVLTDLGVIPPCDILLVFYGTSFIDL